MTVQATKVLGSRASAPAPTSSVETEETAALVSAVCWILRAAAANHLDHATLHSELLQLGTPKEHAGAVSRVFRDHSAALLAFAAQSSLRLTTLHSVERRVILLARLAGDIENKYTLYFTFYCSQWKKGGWKICLGATRPIELQDKL